MATRRTMATTSCERVPLEAQEQEWLFRWAADMEFAAPELALMYHIPNEGKRSRSTGRRMRRQGLRKGVPDICLPVARKGYHALYIELKRTKGSAVSDDQKGWIAALEAAGNKAVVCKGWNAAADVIEEYLGLRKGV